MVLFAKWSNDHLASGKEVLSAQKHNSRDLSLGLTHSLQECGEISSVLTLHLLKQDQNRGCGKLKAQHFALNIISSVVTFKV